MAFQCIAGDGVVLSVWGRTRKDDIAGVLEQLEAAAAEFGGPVTYITRVPAEAPAPDSETRQFINTIMPRVIAACSTYHVVLEGAGFGAAMKRGVLVSLFQIGRRRNMFFVHANPEDVMRKVSAERQLAVRGLLIRADARGLLRGAPPTTQKPLPLDMPPPYQKTSGVRNTNDWLEFRDVRFK